MTSTRLLAFSLAVALPALGVTSAAPSVPVTVENGATNPASVKVTNTTPIPVTVTNPTGSTTVTGSVAVTSLPSVTVGNPDASPVPVTTKERLYLASVAFNLTDTQNSTVVEFQTHRPVVIDFVSGQCFIPTGNPLPLLAIVGLYQIPFNGQPLTQRDLSYLRVDRAIANLSGSDVVAIFSAPVKAVHDPALGDLVAFSQTTVPAGSCTLYLSGHYDP